MIRPRLLLLPGNMCDSRLWDRVRACLEATGFSCRCGDLSRQSTIAAMAADMLDETAGPIIPIGFSMGAIVALEMAKRAPDRLMALVLLALNAGADLPERTAARPRQQAAVRAGQLAHVVTEELKPNYLASANRQDRALLQLTLDMALRLGPQVFVHQSEALRTRDDLRPVLDKLAMPVFLGCGEEDALCPPAWHKAWASAVGPSASLGIFPGAGHLLPLEQPDALSAGLIEWLETVREHA